MKVSKLATGIISIILGGYMFRQANAIYNLAKLANRSDISYYAIPIAAAILLIAAGIVSICTCKTGFSRACSWLYLISTLITFYCWTIMSGFKDLAIYSVWGLAMAIMCFVFTRSAIDNEDDLEENKAHEEQHDSKKE